MSKMSTHHGSDRSCALLCLILSQGLLIQVSTFFRLSELGLSLAKFGQVKSGYLLCFLNLLLIGLDLALELVNQSLHALMVLAVLILLVGQLLDLPLGLAHVLLGVALAPVLGVQLRLQLTDAGVLRRGIIPVSLL